MLFVCQVDQQMNFLFFSEEFNDRILRPELSDTEKMSLHEEVQKIYKTYCLDESIDKIRFDPFIVEEIQRSKFEFGRKIYAAI